MTEAQRAQDPLELRKLLVGQVYHLPVGFVGFIYAAGFIVMTNLYARWSVPAFDLLRVRYLTAGLFYLVVTAALILVLILLGGSLLAVKEVLDSLRVKRRALVDFEAGGDASQTRQNLIAYRTNLRALGARLYLLAASTAFISFPIAILFFAEPPRSRYVLVFFLAMYAGGLLSLTVLRLVQAGAEQRFRDGLIQEESKRRTATVCEVVRWAVVAMMWVFGGDILLSLQIPDEMAHAVFYLIFTMLLALQMMFACSQRLRGIAFALLGPMVYWITIPISMFMVLYLSLVTFAFQVYPSIPASRGGGEVQCVDVEVAESVAGQEVATGGERLYTWHKGLVLLDDRSDMMYLTPKVSRDGSVPEIIAFQRPLIRRVRHHAADIENADIAAFTGLSRLFTGAFWQGIGHRITYVRDFESSCSVR